MSVKKLTWEEAVYWLKEQPDKQELVRYCYYDDPLELAAERFSNSQEWLAVKRLLRNYIPGTVLDLGAGRGISSYAFAKAGCKVTALEPNTSPVVGSQAIQDLFDHTKLPIEIVREYGEKLPFPDNTFDIVYGRAVLHHSYDLQKLCQEATRVLKPKGVFIGTREHVISKKEDLAEFLASHPLHFLYGGENAYLLKEYTEAINKAGMRIQKVLNPYESVINYAPMSQENFQSIVTSILAKRLGYHVADLLGNLKIVRQFCSCYLSQKSNTPGRHYSFIAVKQ